MKFTSSKEVDLDQFIGILEESQIKQSSDFGGVILHDVIHPSMGGVTLMNTACGRCVVVSSV